MADINPAAELPKRNAVVYPVGRDPEGKQIWSVSVLGHCTLNRALMTEISADACGEVENVVWATEPPLVDGTTLNKDWLVWCMSTHHIGEDEARHEGHRRLQFFQFCAIARERSNGQ
jgi:hypothetical protein